jgi:hypothetical protein
MFGGPHAIAVNDAAALPGTALLAGQWDGPTGRYGAAVWTSPDGATWHRNASDPALASAVGEQTSALGAAAGPAGFLVAGDTLRGALLTPLLWTSSDGVAWRRTSLPAPPVTSQSGGATANRAACDERRCVVAGVALGSPWHALCWPVTGTTAGAGTTGPSGDTMLVSQVALAGGQAYLALRVDNRARLMSTGPDCSGWRDVPLPVGGDEVRVGQLSDGLLLATTDATSSELWLRSR